MEHLLAKEGVAGSIPVSRFYYLVAEALFYWASAIFVYLKSYRRYYKVICSSILEFQVIVCVWTFTIAFMCLFYSPYFISCFLPIVFLYILTTSKKYATLQSNTTLAVTAKKSRSHLWLNVVSPSNNRRKIWNPSIAHKNRRLT